ncbi:MAG TPA: CopD family protein [Longimicrobiales bacterium]|nr:CopD family protein [Longimicrobiales bacterium]
MQSRLTAAVRRAASVLRSRSLLAACLLTAVPAIAWAHVSLVATTPARDAVVDEAPPELRLVFSGTIERRYTSITLLAPDGSGVPVGAVEFVAGSDREFTVAMPPVTAPGTYTVQWRTAGADGHVLEGSYTFVLAGDTTGTAADTLPPVAAPVHTDHDHHMEDAAAAGLDVRPIAARWLHFLALVLLTGGLAFRALLLPRLLLAEDLRRDLVRRTWRIVAAAALLLGVAAVLRLWLQSVALHGADRAWNSALLSIMLTDTGWGRAWLFQAFLFAILGAGIMYAQPLRDRAALVIAAIAALGLSAIPALTGHAAGAGGLAWLVVLNDTAHVVAAGAWLGTLAMVMFVLVPGLRRGRGTPAGSIADAVDRFSPQALIAAGVLVATGGINALMHFSEPAQLFGTDYGRALLVKLAVFGLVLLAGFYNWRVTRPRLAAGTDDGRRLRVSAGLELGFAAVVLLATAVLTGLARP